MLPCNSLGVERGGVMGFPGALRASILPSLPTPVSADCRRCHPSPAHSQPSQPASQPSQPSHIGQNGFYLLYIERAPPKTFGIFGTPTPQVPGAGASPAPAAMRMWTRWWTPPNLGPQPMYWPGRPGLGGFAGTQNTGLQNTEFRHLSRAHTSKTQK